MVYRYDLVFLEGVEPKPINAEKAPLSPLYFAGGGASLLRGLSACRSPRLLDVPI